METGTSNLRCDHHRFHLRCDTDHNVQTIAPASKGSAYPRRLEQAHDNCHKQATMVSQALSKSLNRIAQQNEKATQQMAKGAYAKAIVTLTQAVSLMKTIPQHKKILQEERPPCKYQNTLHLPFISVCSPIKERSSATNSSSSSPPPSWYLYKDAVRVVGVEQCCDSSFVYAGQELTKIVSYAVFFNLGLCHQLVGAASKNAISKKNTVDSSRSAGSSFKKLLNRSIALCNHAQKILNKFCQEELSFMFGGDMIHALAITNNLGNIYYCSNQEAMGEVCFQHLWVALITVSAAVPPRHQHSRAPGATAVTTITAQEQHGGSNNYDRLSLLMLDDYDDMHVNGFLRNALNCRVGLSQSAPAA